MTSEDFFTLAVSPITGVVMSAFFGVNALVLKWLSKSFNDLRDDLKNINVKTLDWLNNHENEDFKRHEENLHRFEKISVALARLGSTNGTYEHVSPVHH